MSEIRTRTYTYTGQSSKLVGVCSLPLSSFTASGDANAISEILSITVKYYRYHDTSANVGHTAQLVVGTETISSAKVVKRGDEAWHLITGTFATLPSASSFTLSNVTLKTTMDTKKSSVSWHATSTHPITITITYYSSEFKPFISGLTMYRANSLGAVSDSGIYISFQAKVGVESAGSGGSGTLELRKYTSKTSTSSSTIFTETGISGSTSGITITKAPISGHTLATGSSAYYRAVFTYTATANGITSTESIESAAIYISDVFTNVHLAGVSTGGVRFGGFSTATLNSPKMECDYPAYFYGNIACISNDPNSDGWSSLTPVNGTTPAEFGGGYLRRRKIENKRIIAGSVLVTPGSDTIVIADLKEDLSYDDWAPSSGVFAINACQGARIARIAVGGRGEENEGRLCLSWVRNLSDGSLYTSSAIWVQCSIEYWLN